MLRLAYLVRAGQCLIIGDILVCMGPLLELDGYFWKFIEHLSSSYQPEEKRCQVLT